MPLVAGVYGVLVLYGTNTRYGIGMGQWVSVLRTMDSHVSRTLCIECVRCLFSFFFFVRVENSPPPIVKRINA